MLSFEDKLNYHFSSKHLSFASQGCYFRSKADGLKKTKFDAGGKYHKQHMAAIEVSYLVALRINIAMKPHTIVEFTVASGQRCCLSYGRRQICYAIEYIFLI